ncbi:NAD-dependent DNA ligase LigA [Lachnospira multipara]|uniref:NAD-dependent DNA ligase LigA n=1 Tax=Lachnospira multipara TaxID=28051 RepID=UPI00048665E7|nr:NAD-dependent DNA ligase LigA [Lachnospira multipara]
MNKLDRIKELVEILNEAGKAYYSKGTEIMSNFEYDALYDELVALEKETGHVLSNSPTINVGFETLSELPKERHESPMLSLDKTKQREELRDWLGENVGLLSWKLDGLTIVLTYENGSLSKAVTRGNGEIGEIITNNAKVFKNIPLNIPYKGKLVLRGEAIISYSDFERINELIPEADAKYKNPRNLCSGSVRQLNNKITKERNVQFRAFNLVSAEDVDFKNSRQYQFEWLKEQGFDVVEYKRVTKDNILDEIQNFYDAIPTNDLPSDGLVILYDDIAYGDSLGRTAKFPRNSMAFKWSDETAKTNLRKIEWSASRTGLLNPVAIFDTVELEGTNVSRASVHNISVMEGLNLGLGDEIEVFKANMIIPQIAKNLTNSGNMPIPDTCPVCGGKTEVRSINDVKFLYCVNEDCQAKHVGRFTHFVGRDAMNIDGLSEATLEKFIGCGFIHDYVDLFHLDRYADEIMSMEGFGEKSYNKLITAINNARKSNLVRVIFGLGIENIGLSNAKMIVKAFKGEDNNDTIRKILNANVEELTSIDGVGEVIASGFVRFFSNEANLNLFNRLLDELELEEVVDNQVSDILQGKVLVVTGTVNIFPNRNAIKELVETLGGKVTGSVTSKTDYLINNDSKSQSTKNKTAAKLGVPVITEEEFIRLIGREDMLS